MSVALVTDSCHYLPAEIATRLGLHEVSLYVNQGGATVRETEITDYRAYYRGLADLAQLPSTSQPSIGDFLAVWQPLLEAGDEVISVHIAGGISGTVRAAEQARDQLGELAPHVHIVDSRGACGIEGLMLMGADAVLRAGGSVDDALARMQQVHETIRLVFAVDTLEYLRRGGRIGPAAAFLGTALKIKPLLRIDGEILPVERVRTSKKAFERLVDKLEECKQAGSEAWVIQHIQAHDQVTELIERGRAIFGHDPVFSAEIGPVIGTHIGPGLLGAGAIPSALLQA